ncbi:MAG TPA: hypothetical protein VKV15_06860 [Bryobacteraceae bacterium]|nr:hypothetical protein [Bryobacteraceae bacterium]
MRGRKPADILDIDEVRTRFENWRQTRKGKACIPDELWSAAVEVARRDGVNQTAAALHLDGGKLKRRMMATGPVPDKTMPPAFVEMMVPHAVDASECTIELEGRNGKLRIHGRAPRQRTWPVRAGRCGTRPGGPDRTTGTHSGCD